ncbi:formimidoylglutamate deiminase [Tabrizicola sp. TH137]|uniref:formimidoylglutamate deiminase n=1 Tax=Tabrizicola sp. TH137 TaxID=2067452 RepID=UPI000C7B549C|nr:formimidoylglutamate deiminase [Tabrizicola sp. TH137]PLL13583.1 formimidoylglutamate deiminase [Tabrizicola sp. TH137]
MLIHAERALLPGGWASDVGLRIEDGRIASVGPAAGGMRVGCLLPAPVNLHSHMFQRAMAGMTERRSAGQDSFWTWRSLMYRFLDRLTPEDVEAIAAQVMVEMAEAGFAAVAEFHYLHHQPGGAPYANLAEMSERIVNAAEETGFGLTLLPVLYQRGGCDGRALTSGQKRFGNDPERFAALWEGAAASVKRVPDGVTGVAPHSLRAVDRAGLRMAEEIAPGAPIHIHLAEQVAEVEEVSAAMGARPVEWLLANAAVDGRWCPIHCTQMTEGETVALARSGAVAGLCPITEANLGDGIFDGVRFAAAGGHWGVGSDSNVRISLAEELRLFEYSQRLRNRGRAMLADGTRSTGRVLWEGCVAGGAMAAGRASGAIAEGAVADLVALEMGALHLAGREGDEILDAFVFAGNDALVAEVWSAGRHVVTGGRHVAREAVERRFRAVMAGLRERA